MVFLVMLTIVALTIAVVALQNGQAVTTSFLFWQFQAPLALVILLAAAGGLLLGALVSWTRALRGWRDRGTPASTSARTNPAGPVRTQVSR